MGARGSGGRLMLVRTNVNGEWRGADVWPGSSVPLRSASSIMAMARRSFTELMGLKNSHLTYRLTFFGASR